MSPIIRTETKRVMCRSMLIAMTASISSCRSSAQKTSEATPTSGENVEQVLMQMEREWAAAPYKRDAATLERIIADDWVAFTWDGETISKAQVIADAKSGANTAESVNLQGVKVCVFGDAAVVTGGVIEKSRYSGRRTQTLTGAVAIVSSALHHSVSPR